MQICCTALSFAPMTNNPLQNILQHYYLQQAQVQLQLEAALSSADLATTALLTQIMARYSTAILSTRRSCVALPYASRC